MYDLTVRFCDKYISRRSRTHDQIVQAARSGVQNIVAGSQASGTSKKMEMKLTNVARASLEELRCDYEDFLRQRDLPQWEKRDPRREELIRRSPKSIAELAQWAKDMKSGQSRRSGPSGQSPSTTSTESTSTTAPTYPEITANGILALIIVACFLLDRQLAAQAAAFRKGGGFTERLYHEHRCGR